MDDSTTVRTLILSDRPTAARRWAEMLEPFWPQIGEPDKEPPEATEVIVTDLVPIRGDDLGVVRIGSDGPADASLPEDVTARELRQVCRLVARIVRLRRDRRDE
ncbi:MAG TPA: hypothetical protein VE890_07175, partial [Thermoguttaceae bacterium]|nr:hypothetical protein [Thermoguttaceae bacterium]